MTPAIMNGRGRARVWLGDFVQDLRFGARLLGKHRGFSVIAIATLALGIGAATAMFSVINAVLLRPLPFPHAERLVQILETHPARDVTDAVSYANYLDWQSQSGSWEAIGAWKRASVNVRVGGQPERLPAHFVTSNVLATFGLAPELGRSFLPEEDDPGRARVALLSTGLWRRAFGGDRGAVGRTITIDGHPHTIVGVAPPQLFPGEADVLLPLGQYAWAEGDARERRSDRELTAVGRLKPQVALAAAASEMSTLASRIAQAHPEELAGWTVRLEPLLDLVVGDSRRRALFLLLGAVAVLLLIACANLGSLLVVSSARRTRELSLRSVLGSTGGRHVRQLMTESLLLCGLGGAAGLLLARGSLVFLRTMDVASLPRAGEIDLDGRVFLFACAATLLTAILSGLLPAWQASRMDIRAGIEDGGRVGSAARGPLRDALIVGQLALSVVLLAAAGLSLRTLHRLGRVDLGYRPERVVSLRIAPERDATNFLRTLLDSLHTRPELEAAAVTSGPPLADGGTANEVFPVDPALLPPHTPLAADWRIVSADYFRTMGVPMVKGRVFTPNDHRQAPKVIVVNETFARAMWGDGHPIGKRVSPGGGPDASTVVGVVGDVRMQDPGVPPKPAYYMSMYRGLPPRPMTLVVRGMGAAPAVVATVREEVKRLDAALPVYAVETGEAAVRRRLAARRLLATLLAAFAGLALVLAAVGLYGVMAYATEQRTREVGIRVALGAQPGDVLQALLRDAGVLIGIGTAIGLGAALAAVRWMGSRMADLGASDPVALSMAAAVLMVVSLLACYVPARRALHVSPRQALRSE